MDFLPDEQVISITADSVNALGLRDCHRLVQRLTLRQKMILMPLFAEAILDVYPDQAHHPLSAGNVQSRIPMHNDIARVAYFMEPVWQRRCHVNCGCWHDVRANRQRLQAQAAQQHQTAEDAP